MTEWQKNLLILIRDASNIMMQNNMGSTSVFVIKKGGLVALKCDMHISTSGMDSIVCEVADDNNDDNIMVWGLPIVGDEKEKS